MGDDEYEELGGGDGEWVLDEDGYVVFNLEGVIEAIDYGWLPSRGRIWENPQLRLTGFEPDRVEYHGTTYDRLVSILEGHVGWTGLERDLPQQALDDSDPG